MAEWPDWLRGRAYYRLGLALEESDELCGEFVFAGYVCYWRRDLANKTIAVSLGYDL